MGLSIAALTFYAAKKCASRQERRARCRTDIWGLLQEQALLSHGILARTRPRAPRLAIHRDERRVKRAVTGAEQDGRDEPESSHTERPAALAVDPTTLDRDRAYLAAIVASSEDDTWYKRHGIDAGVPAPAARSLTMRVAVVFVRIASGAGTMPDVG
jgi:hypothetical protein